MALEAWMYGDPEDVAARREAIRQRKERECAACVRMVRFEFKGEEINLCEFNGRNPSDRRCLQFKRRDEAK